MLVINILSWLSDLKVRINTGDDEGDVIVTMSSISRIFFDSSRTVVMLVL